MTATTTENAFYVTTSEYVGPNTLDSNGAIIVREPVATISTEPGRTNQSGQVRTEGWLGTTNDWSESAHGEFETLEAARAYCADQGWTVPVVSEDPYDQADGVEYYQSPVAAAEHWSASDWFSSVSASDLGITAETTDAELETKATAEEAEAADYKTQDHPYGAIIHGTEEYLRSVRDDLR